MSERASLPEQRFPFGKQDHVGLVIALLPLMVVLAVAVIANYRFSSRVALYGSIAWVVVAFALWRRSRSRAAIVSQEGVVLQSWLSRRAIDYSQIASIKYESGRLNHVPLDPFTPLLPYDAVKVRLSNGNLVVLRLRPPADGGPPPLFAALELRWTLHRRNDSGSALPKAVDQACPENFQAHDVASRTFAIAVALEQQGDLESARGAFLSCMSFRHPEWSPRAALTLGESLSRRADPAAALRALKEADVYGHETWSARAKIVIAAVYAGQLDLEAAERYCRAAIATGERDCAPMGWFNLGTLYQQKHEYERALEMYEQALASSHPDYGPRAAVNIGFVRFNYLRDTLGAEEAWRIALDSKHPQQGPLAARNLVAMRSVLENGKLCELQAFDDDTPVTDGRSPIKYRIWKAKQRNPS